MKMDKKMIQFNDAEIEKQNFHQDKSLISISNIDINKIVVSNKVSCGKKGFKCFFCYKDAKKLRPLCIFLQEMSVYRRDFDETKYMTFLIKDDELLKNIIKF